VIGSTVGTLIGDAVKGRPALEKARREEARRRGEDAPAADEGGGEEIVVRGRRRPVTDAEIAAERARNAAEDRSLDLLQHGYAPVTSQTQEQNNAIVDEAQRFTQARTDVDAGTKQSIIGELEDRRNHYNSILPAAAAAVGTVVGATAVAADVTSGGSFSLFGYNLLSYGGNGFQLGGSRGLTVSFRSGTAAVSVGGSNGVNLTASARLNGLRSIDLSARASVGGGRLVDGNLALSTRPGATSLSGGLTLDGGRLLNTGLNVDVGRQGTFVAGRLYADEGLLNVGGSLSVSPNNDVFATGRLSLSGGERLDAGGTFGLNDGGLRISSRFNVDNGAIDTAGSLRVGRNDIGLSDSRLRLGGYTLVGDAAPTLPALAADGLPIRYYIPKLYHYTSDSGLTAFHRASR